ncbi:MAG: hypothetical protein CBB66_06860 [bacterium TMED6]|nr:MAG: hypothetical protein CBB66_06860 [bacterium TMED6]
MRYYILTILISISFTQVFSTYDYVGSRATAMSGATTTGADIESAIFHNPAQLSDSKGKKIISGFSHLYDLEFLTYTHFGLSYDSYAINFEKMSTEFNNTDLSSELAIGISKGMNIYKDRQSLIQTGIRFNIFSYDFGQTAGTAGDGSNGIDIGSGIASGVDIGFQGVLNNKYYVGYYLQNVFRYIEDTNLGSSLPQTFSIGLSYRPYEDLLTSLDINQLSGHINQEIRLGIEYKIMDSFTIRTGLQSNPNRFSGGFQYSLIDNIDISYSFLTHHVLSTTHQFSISVKF